VVGDSLKNSPTKAESDLQEKRRGGGGRVSGSSGAFSVEARTGVSECAGVEPHRPRSERRDIGRARLSKVVKGGAKIQMHRGGGGGGASLALGNRSTGTGRGLRGEMGPGLTIRRVKRKNMPRRGLENSKDFHHLKISKEVKGFGQRREPEYRRYVERSGGWGGG